ncbi:MAG: acylphosphatase [Actinomycetota bacterium]|jgi:acylphosphatase|nr:acylphosphatase [Actinomycetota bacterium]
MIRRRLVVSGEVQGVFYRDTCRSIAESAGVAGSASNLPDGHVEVVLEGPEDAVEKVVAWCRRGTPQSTVQGVDIEEEEPLGDTSFRVL